MKDLNHFDEKGAAIMVDVGAKPISERIAVASGKIFVSDEIFKLIESGTSKKGDILGVARIAGIMAAKKTGDIIPLCHPLQISHCAIDFNLLADESAVEAVATVKISAKTGVEMETLHAVSVALLTIYDMCKAVDKQMIISDIKLLKKLGGKTDFSPSLSLSTKNCDVC